MDLSGALGRIRGVVLAATLQLVGSLSVLGLLEALGAVWKVGYRGVEAAVRALSVLWRVRPRPAEEVATEEPAVAPGRREETMAVAARGTVWRIRKARVIDGTAG